MLGIITNLLHECLEYILIYSPRKIVSSSENMIFPGGMHLHTSFPHNHAINDIECFSVSYGLLKYLLYDCLIPSPLISDILQSEKKTPLYSPACDLGGQYNFLICPSLKYIMNFKILRLMIIISVVQWNIAFLNVFGYGFK